MISLSEIVLRVDPPARSDELPPSPADQSEFIARVSAVLGRSGERCEERRSFITKDVVGKHTVGEALTWLQRAAERADAENPHALHELAQLYETAPAGGNGKVIRDEVYAFQCYEQGAKLGYSRSQTRLGKCYEYGQLGCAIDNRSSIHWYSKAAAQEDSDAELALSGWYLTGSAGILDQSDQEAYLWARKAALKECAKAEYAMGYFSEVGIGCPRSLEDAKRWYGRAAGKS